MAELLEEFEKSVKNNLGDIIEIGAGHGDTTVHLANLGVKYNRRVFVIDPFEDGWDKMPDSYGRPYPYNTFKERVLDRYNNVTLIKKFSNDTTLANQLKKPISLAFVDGLQYEENVVEDLSLMQSLEASVICIDDFTRDTGISQVKRGMDKFLPDSKYRFSTTIKHFVRETVVAFLELK
jgi:hypothetical protein